MKNKKFNQLNKYEIEILDCFNEMCISFPLITKEAIMCEIATKLNILDKKNKNYLKAFMNLYNKGYFEKDIKISV